MLRRLIALLLVAALLVPLGAISMLDAPPEDDAVATNTSRRDVHQDLRRVPTIRLALLPRSHAPPRCLGVGRRGTSPRV